MTTRIRASAIALDQDTGTAAANDAELRELAKVAGLEPLPYGLQVAKGDPITRENIDLGKMLFFDPRLSANGVNSCNTWHNLGSGGDDDLVTSVGHGWQKGPRNSPTAFNAVFNKAQFWDGRAEDLNLDPAFGTAKVQRTRRKTRNCSANDVHPRGGYRR